jgi:hypothetical protein
MYVEEKNRRMTPRLIEKISFEGNLMRNDDVEILDLI